MKIRRNLCRIVFFSIHFFFGSHIIAKALEITPGEISIVASTPIPEGVKATYQSYVDLVDCGFNVGMQDQTWDYFLQQFEIIGNLNFKYLVANSSLYTASRNEIVNKLKDQAKFAGWKFKDEPTYDALINLKKQYDELLKLDNKNLIYINLVGIVLERFTGPYSNLGDYLDYFNTLFHPEVWSYDLYPIITKNGKTQSQTEPFYYALESFSAQAKKTNRPFWAYCESMQYKTDTYSRPAATEAHLRFEAFSALAYGAQGIVYWTYAQRPSNAAETYQSALVNLDGKKTKSWYAAQKVNREIKKYNDVFYGCNVLDVRHTGDKLYRGTRKLSGEFGPFKMIRSKEAGVMVSYIENKGHKYIVIVNRDPFKKQKINLELKPNNNIVDLSSPNNTEYTWRKDISITLDKGGYVIFKER